MSEPGSLLRSLSGKPAARNFHTFVINEIGTAIVSGRFPVGSILPSDAEMMSSYNVSRTVVREALRTLEAKGMVEARPKVGTRVSHRSRWNLFDPQLLAWHFDADLAPAFVEGLFDVRRSLEARAADLASRHRTAEHVRMLKYWAHEMELTQGEAESHALAALEIHRIIADASGNPLLRSALGLVELTLALAAVAGTAEARTRLRAAQTEASQILVAQIETGEMSAAVTAADRLLEIEQAHALAGDTGGGR